MHHHHQIDIEANGIGMPPEMLAQIPDLLDHEEGVGVVAERGFGINNLNQWVKL